MARPAAVVAEVADVGGCVLERQAAGDAVGRVGGVRQTVAGDRGVVETEPDNAVTPPVHEVGQERVVYVDHRPRARGQLGHGAAPALRDQLELAVAVELVAKEVAETHGARPDLPDDLGKRSLVDLEHRELRIFGLEQGRGDTGDQVRPGAVVCEAQPGTEDVRQHRARRRLSVRRGDERTAEREARGELRERSGVEGGEQLAGEGRPAPATGEPRETPGRPREPDLERESHRSQSRALLPGHSPSPKRGRHSPNEGELGAGERPRDPGARRFP